MDPHPHSMTRHPPNPTLPTPRAGRLGAISGPYMGNLEAVMRLHKGSFGYGLRHALEPSEETYCKLITIMKVIYHGPLDPGTL